MCPWDTESASVREWLLNCSDHLVILGWGVVDFPVSFFMFSGLYGDFPRSSEIYVRSTEGSPSIYRVELMAADWLKTLESFPNEFRDLSRSYPKIFYARLIAEYWTDRLTRGQIIFEEKCMAEYFDFDTASKATYENHVSAVSV